MNHKLLIIDDDYRELTDLQQLFGKHNWLVLYAHTAEKAYAIAREFTPSVLLLDYYMPGIDTQAICSGLRTLLPNALMIAYSIHNSGGQSLQQAGCDLFISKQTRPQLIVDFITSEVARHYPQAIPPLLQVPAGASRKPPHTDKVVTAIREGYTTPDQLKRTIGLSQTSLWRIVRWLLENQIIEAAGVTRNRTYRIVDDEQK